MQALLRKARAGRTATRKLVDGYKYAGVLQMEEDPVELQRK